MTGVCCSFAKLLSHVNIAPLQSYYYHMLTPGLRESVKKLDKREALLCVLAESTDEKNIIKLVEALCKEHGINLIKVGERCVSRDGVYARIVSREWGSVTSRTRVWSSLLPG